MSILDATIARLDGTPATLGEITGGRPALLVNVASKCGLTPQYTGLEQLQEQYADARLHRRRRCPATSSAARSPARAEEIAEFCSATYGVTFPMTEKVEVNGEGRHAIYDELVGDARREGQAGDITWNFEKFLVDARRPRRRPVQPPRRAGRRPPRAVHRRAPQLTGHSRALPARRPGTSRHSVNP